MEKTKPEKIAEILSGQGMQVSLEQAKAIAGFVENMARIFVLQYMQKEEETVANAEMK